ncbi:hypothetical protein [Paenibacillus sp. YN15]|uniref:hypothetical protein n=1 Tax=Paenibacillus sp. YN15 TaxID=1742774 RepID=UPI0015EB3FD5|nr:hypothetical protein [Paenibacillus sp. YN15]
MKKNLMKGERVRIHGDTPMHGEVGEVVEVLDGFVRVKFVNWSGGYVVLIYEGYIREPY